MINIRVFLKKGSTLETKHVHVHSSLVHIDLANDQIVQQSLLCLSARSHSSRSTTHLCVAKTFLAKRTRTSKKKTL